MQEMIYQIAFSLSAVMIIGSGVRAIWRLGKWAGRKSMRGVTMVEYAILLALIAIAVATSFPSITTAIKNVFSNASSVMSTPAK